MKRLVLLAFLLATAPLSAQNGKFGGTFTGAVVVEEGIVLAADSRSTFLDASGKPMGYIDGMTKVFVEHGAGFAVSGLTSIEGELFSSFVRRNHFLLARPVNEILFGVSLWLPFRNSTGVFLISAGFVNGAATICARNPTDPQVCRNSGYITNKESPGLRRWLTAQNGAVPKVAEAAAAVRQAIREAAGLDATIGGPITILYLPRSGSSQWLENPPGDSRWTTICDIVEDYRRGRAQIVFTNSKQELDPYLNGACPR